MPAQYLTFIVDTSSDNKIAYLRLTTEQIFHFKIRPRTLDTLPKYFIGQSVFVGFIFGILILAIVYNAAIGFAAREKSFLYYALYELCITFYLASASGYLRIFMGEWNSGGQFNNFGVIVSAGSAFLFVRSLLDTEKMQPDYDRFMRKVVYVVFASAAFIPFLPHHLSYPLTEVIGLICPALILVAGIRALKLGHPLAKYFLAAWTIFICIASTWAWMWLGLIEPSENLLRTLLAGAALEALLLSLILGFRYRHLKRTTEDQVAEINTYQTLSETDELTGILNRRGLINRVRSLITDNIPFVWVAVDVDHFKQFNDNHGHLAGDQLLEQLGKIIQSEGRRDDIAGRLLDESSQQLAGRVGGEEFAVILSDCKLEDAERYLHRLTQKFHNTTVITPSGTAAGTTLSIGATEYLSGEPLESTWKRADTLLYEAKNAGRNKVIARNSVA